MSLKSRQDKAFGGIIKPIWRNRFSGGDSCRNVVRACELIRNSNSTPAIRRTDLSRWSKNPAIGTIEYGQPVVESSQTPAMKLFQQYADDRSSE